MSHQPKNAPHSSSSLPPQQHSADVVALAGRFQEATQALLSLCQQTPEPERAASSPLAAQQQAEQGETRSYYYSPAVLQHERELLRHYRAQNLADLLEETHLRLVGLVKLMKSVHADMRVKGQVINSLGCLLEQASSLVLRMSHVYAKVRRVEDSAPGAPSR